MKAIFAWLSLLVSLANLFNVASGQPEEPLAMGKIPGAEAEGLGAAVDIGPARQLPVQPENQLETGRLEEVYEKVPFKLPTSIENAKGSILDKHLKSASYVPNPEKVVEQLLSHGEGIPEVKQGKVVAGDAVVLDSLTLKKRPGGPKKRLCKRDSDCMPGQICVYKWPGMPGLCQVWPVPTPEPKTPRKCKKDSDCPSGKFCSPSKRPWLHSGTCIRLPKTSKFCKDDSDCSPVKNCENWFPGSFSGICVPKKVKPVYCPNGFELDPIFKDQVKPYVEGTHLMQYCEVVIERAIRCKNDQTCKAIHFNMKDCGYPNQDISCIKNTTACGGMCTMELAPLCGSDGKTYGNDCEFHWAQKCDDPSLTIKHQGECAKAPELPAEPCVKDSDCKSAICNSAVAEGCICIPVVPGSPHGYCEPELKFYLCMADSDCPADLPVCYMNVFCVPRSCKIDSDCLPGKICYISYPGITDGMCLPKPETMTMTTVTTTAPAQDKCVDEKDLCAYWINGPDGCDTSFAKRTCRKSCNMCETYSPSKPDKCKPVGGKCRKKNDCCGGTRCIGRVCRAKRCNVRYQRCYESADCCSNICVQRKRGKICL